MIRLLHLHTLKWFVFVFDGGSALLTRAIVRALLGVLHELHDLKVPDVITFVPVFAVNGQIAGLVAAPFEIFCLTAEFGELSQCQGERQLALAVRFLKLVPQ